VCTYTTVSTVSAPSLLGGLVDLDVLDDQVAGVKTLGVGVGLGVLEETDEDLSGLDGPAGLGDTESLACSSQPVFLQLPTLDLSLAPESSLAGAVFRVCIVRIVCRATHPEQCVQCCQRTASWG
jgi:hypothetical protein